MRNARLLTILTVALVILLCQGNTIHAESMGTAFTYQGRLMDKNRLVDGLYSFQFKLYDSNDPCTGNLLGSPIDINDLDVIDGLFVVELDFGSGIFDGNAVWLETSVVESPMGSDPATLSPLLELTPTPYALYAETAGNVTGASGDNDWIIDGDDMYSAVSGNVGIGTSSPSEVLDVNGHINSTETYKINGNTVLSNQGTDNIFVGQGAGSTTTSGFNSAIGGYAFYSNTTGAYNSAIGSHALYSNTTGNYNVGVGSYALKNNTTGFQNTAIGHNALVANTTGIQNSAVGMHALNDNSTGNYNSAIGSHALYSNTTGGRNSAVGYSALYSNTTGSHNSAMGFQALASNTTGSFNTAVGHHALYDSNEGVSNSAMGCLALASNTTGEYNSAMGNYALYSNKIGKYNTGIGSFALASNTTGSSNSVIGGTALYSNTTGYANAALGYNAGYNSTGSRNVFLGYMAGYNETGDDRLYIENSDSNSPLIYGEFDNDLLVVNGTLDVNGPIYQRGGVLHADYVFETDYPLESIEAHSESMWSNKHLPAVPQVDVDETGNEVIDIGSHQRGMLEELEKAHIYIEQLHKQNKALEERLVKLEAIVDLLHVLQEGGIK